MRAGGVREAGEGEALRGERGSRESGEGPQREHAPKAGRGGCCWLLRVCARASAGGAPSQGCWRSVASAAAAAAAATAAAAAAAQPLPRHRCKGRRRAVTTRARLEPWVLAPPIAAPRALAAPLPLPLAPLRYAPRAKKLCQHGAREARPARAAPVPAARHCQDAAQVQVRVQRRLQAQHVQQGAAARGSGRGVGAQRAAAAAAAAAAIVEALREGQANARGRVLALEL